MGVSHKFVTLFKE